MNERIKSLIELAEVWNTEGDVDKCEVDLYKFAELIVKECVKVARPKLTDVGEWAAGMRLVQKRLKQRFGVN